MSAVDTTQVQMFKVEIDFVLHNSNSKNIFGKEMNKHCEVLVSCSGRKFDNFFNFMKLQGSS